MFVEDFALLIVKNYLLLKFVKTIWLMHMVFHLCPHVQFPSRNIFSHDFLLNIIEKTKHAYVIQACYRKVLLHYCQL
jgi:hypothetical protein